MYKLESVHRSEKLIAFHKTGLIDHFQVENVIDEAQEKIHLWDNHVDDVSLWFLNKTW